MTAGENLRSFFPPPFQAKIDNFLNDLKNKLSEQVTDTLKIRFDLLCPNGQFLPCYHLPTMDDKDSIHTIKLVCPISM